MKMPPNARVSMSPSGIPVWRFGKLPANKNASTNTYMGIAMNMRRDEWETWRRYSSSSISLRRLGIDAPHQSQECGLQVLALGGYFLDRGVQHHLPMVEDDD